MKNLILIFLFLCSVSAYSVDRFIYGEDDRTDFSGVTNLLFQKHSLSTAAMIKNIRLIPRFGRVSIVSRSSVLCSNEKFSTEPIASICSGFLVADDIIATAGHCLQDQLSCEQYSWVFDYNSKNRSGKEMSVPPSSVYKCKEVIVAVRDRFSQEDFALIRLDRKVTDRAPLTIRTEGIVEDSARLVMMGYPSGLSLKITTGAKIRNNSSPFVILTDLDAFSGNSGSPVFNEATGVVEGILVRGDGPDYVTDTVNKCERAKTCTQNDCRGEDLSRISQILPFLPN